MPGGHDPCPLFPSILGSALEVPTLPAQLGATSTVPTSLASALGAESERLGSPILALPPCGLGQIAFPLWAVFPRWLNGSQMVLFLGLSCSLTVAPAQRRTSGANWGSPAPKPSMAPSVLQMSPTSPGLSGPIRAGSSTFLCIPFPSSSAAPKVCPVSFRELGTGKVCLGRGSPM